MAIHQLPPPLSARRRLLLGVAATALVAAGACSSSDGQPTPGDPSVTTDAPAKTGIIAKTESASCAAERMTLLVAIKVFEALNGTKPSDERALADAGILREVSELFDITGDGRPIPAAGGPCA